MPADRDTTDGAPRFHRREDGVRIAYHESPGRSPTVVFLGGFSSDMTGTKARYLEGVCRRRGQAYVRFDYRGHGRSSGAFVDGTIGAWRDDALCVLRECTSGPLLLVGSSMGAWIMLLAALASPERVRGMVGIASAPDFTEELVWGSPRSWSGDDSRPSCAPSSRTAASSRCHRTTKKSPASSLASSSRRDAVTCCSVGVFRCAAPCA